MVANTMECGRMEQWRGWASTSLKILRSMMASGRKINQMEKARLSMKVETNIRANGGKEKEKVTESSSITMVMSMKGNGVTTRKMELAYTKGQAENLISKLITKMLRKKESGGIVTRRRRGNFSV